MSKGLKIAIDGPAGAGKSTVAKALAHRLGYRYIDTGAMYRALTLRAVRRDIDLSVDDELVRLAEGLEVEMELEEDGGLRVFADGEDVTSEIRSPEVNRMVSRIAEVEKVRRVMVEKQNELARVGGVVMDGRDIGTVVLPDADKKFYLTASINERVERRYKELKEKGIQLEWEDIERSIRERDEIDTSRKIAPLSIADDAIVVDTTDMSVKEVVKRVLSECQED